MKIYENLDINDLENELWKDILDYDGDYQVSNIGRVKSFKRYKNGKIMRQNKVGDYFCIDLCKNGKYKSKQIHILVFESHNNCKLKSDECVHHVDKNEKNNIFENLEKMPKSEHSSFHSKGKNNPMFGKHHTNETKKKISEKVKGDNHPLFGKHHSTESKNKISNTRKEKFKNGTLFK